MAHALKGRKQSEEHIENRIKALKGKKRTSEQRDRISKGRMGIRISSVSIMKGIETRRKNGWFKNLELTRKRMSEGNVRARLGTKSSIETRMKQSLSLRGEKNPNWQGGKEPINNRIRKSLEYIIWRTSVLARDNFTCQICDKRGGRLQVDHIKPFALFPQLRFVLENGRTLCVACHRKTDTHGYRKIYRNKK